MPLVEEVKGKVIKQECFAEEKPSEGTKVAGWDYSFSSKSL